MGPTGLEPDPSACKADALPAELRPHIQTVKYLSSAARFAIILLTVANCQQLFNFSKNLELYFFTILLEKRKTRAFQTCSGNRNFYFKVLICKRENNLASKVLSKMRIGVILKRKQEEQTKAYRIPARRKRTDAAYSYGLIKRSSQTCPEIIIAIN